ncbi:hypothetical protein Gogos_017188, partial [Gossypium gossypioides]|nr:hypothetical protein [Gossypium gossypioides]
PTQWVFLSSSFLVLSSFLAFNLKTPVLTQLSQTKSHLKVKFDPNFSKNPDRNPTMTYNALKAVSLTHVRYQRGDQLGHFLAWVSLVPVFISLGGFVSHFIFRRELQSMFFALGLVISQFINEFIKKSVQQARPETCALLEMCDSHGWPSSHSQYMFFFAVYFTLLTCKGIGGIWNVRTKWAALFLPWSLAVLTMYSRVYLGYHTVAQVLAGASLGILLGGLWFWVVNSMLFCYFPLIEESPFGRFFYVKDTSHISDVLKFEYDNARAARNTMAARKAMASKSS